MAESENPYASPADVLAADAEVALAPAEIEGTRRQYLKHEASIQSIGSLYYLSGAFMGFVSLALPIGSIVVGTLPGPFEITIWLFYVALTFLMFLLGTWLRRLDGRVRIPVIILSVIGLLGFPIGTVINAVVLYLMCSSKTTMVFSPYYHDVIAQTPHIRYRTSIVIRILVILLIVMLVGSVVAFLSLAALPTP